MIERRLIAVEGLVQGVGFRPFVHRLATRLELRGLVRNDSAGVSIDVEGERAAVETFVRELTTAPPPLAAIERVRSRPAAALAPAGHHGFRIAPSDDASARRSGATLISPDIATCDECLRALFDPADRRWRYPFVSCSHCGPRLTVALGVPYDRSRTTMRTFPLCEACRREYEDPRDRRFHAQTAACAACGPSLAALDVAAAATVLATRDDALALAIERLLDGGIVAIKGLGGYHLACDAANDDAVRRLRARKRREAKPLAIMMRDVDAARRVAIVSPDEAALLESPARPIVLLERRTQHEIAGAVAPGGRQLGIMLPYTPLHHLLLADVGRALVMTSGNRSDEPIAHRDDDAIDRLSDIADLFLTHDRAIATRCDDSVTRVTAGAPTFVRRSRGFAPRPVGLAREIAAPTLGVGGHLKNTFCLAAGRSAFMSHHVGDLEHPGAARALEDEIDRYAALLDVHPEVIAHDLNRDYASTRVAERFVGARLVAVQHHHAHVASCLAEHRVTEPAIGVAYDGAGLGTDGTIWGGELLLVDGARFRRMAHLRYVPLPGGDAAARHPWRMAVAHLWAAYDGDLARVPISYLDQLDRSSLALLEQMLARGTNSPPTSSIGRLFDAVASLLGVRHSSRFEAQAAMELEALASSSDGRGYHVDVAETAAGWEIDGGSIVRGVVHDIARGRSASEIAGAFHDALSTVTADVAARISQRTGVRTVALTGGAFQNARLLEGAANALARAGLDVLVHRAVPCNDGGLSLGQVWVCA